MARVEALGAFFNLLPVPLYRSSPDGTLLAGNEALAALLGYPGAKQMLAERERVYNYFADPETRNRWVEQIRQHGVVRDFDVELLRRDGRSIWVRDTARAVHDDAGDVVYFEGSLVDVTDRIMLQQSKDLFVATVSHEIRNPIAAILGLGRELASDYDGFTDAERREMISIIAREADEASLLIDDLLVAHHTDPAQISVVPKSFDVSEEINRVVGADVQVDAPAGIEVFADPGRTRQILRNLLINAGRYGGPRIRVSVEDRGEQVTIAIADSGPPIADEYLDQIFQPYGRVPGGQHSGSAGLGLTVCRRLCELMNGSLSYRHTAGWSTFVLVLPAG
ncbi:MAG: HAMP domain-containing histidine kinase [Acidimicrobiia bacterium]|nr:HAMP domain-containing histidine kinase [Acidimicrobiia bacterium]MDH3463209.1 HAMP domain-containing histidine kinase [Acidimicrobiia bacterium]